MSPPPDTFPGCHGVRIEPAQAGAAYGTTHGTPAATLTIGAEPLRPAVPADAERLWAAEVDDTHPGAHTHVMWRLGDGSLLLSIGDRQVLQISRGRDVTTVGAVSDAVARQLVSTFAIPLAAQTAGAFVIHAAVAVRGEATVAICAESGTGKSSLLIALADAGWSTLSEDLVAVDIGSLTAWPGPPWVRVAHGSPGPGGAAERFRTPDKVAWDLDGSRCDHPVPLTHLVLLDPPTALATSCRIAVADEVIGALARHTPWFEEPSRRGASLFASAVRVARAVPAVRLRLRRSPDWAAAAVASVESIVA